MPKSKTGYSKKNNYIKIKTTELKEVKSTEVDENGEHISTNEMVMVPAIKYVLRANHNFNILKRKSA